jgi:hypothetical protein
MFHRQTLTRAALGLLGAAVLAVGGAGFLTTSNAATDSPACPASGAAATGAQTNGSGGTGGAGGTGGTVAAGTSAPGAAAGTPGNAAAGLTSLVGSVVPASGTDALTRLVAAIEQAVATTPIGAATTAAQGATTGATGATGAPTGGPTGATNGGLFVGASTQSSRTGATVTPKPEGGSTAGIVGLPGTSGGLTNLGL